MRDWWRRTGLIGHGEPGCYADTGPYDLPEVLSVEASLMPKVDGLRKFRKEDDGSDLRK